MLKKNSISGKTFDLFNYTFMILLALVMVYPFYNAIIISVSAETNPFALGIRFIPKDFTFAAYNRLLLVQKNSENINYIYTGYFNTIFRTVIGTILTVILSFSAAYALTRKKLPFRNTITTFFLFTMFFSGGIIPFYILIRDLGLIDSRFSLILPTLYSMWYMIFMRNYIQSIPESMEEAAMVDGANPLYIMFRIIFPLSMPIVATVALWSAVAHWNAWFDALLYITDDKKQVLQMILRRIIIVEGNRQLKGFAEVQTAKFYTEMTIKNATIILTIGPIILAYPFAQKYFIKGIMIGSLKG